MTLAETLQDPGFKAMDDWRKLAIENTNFLCVPCSHYAGFLLDYIETFGGGDGAPCIKFIDMVSKQFGANVALDETYWKALASTEFSDKQCKYPLVRAALMLTNHLTTDKIEDSVARLLSKGHTGAVASNQKAVEASEAEMLLGNAFSIAEAVSSVEKLVKPLGQLFVRLGLKLTDQEKRPRNKFVFGSRAEEDVSEAGIC